MCTVIFSSFARTFQQTNSYDSHSLHAGCSLPAQCQRVVDEELPWNSASAPSNASARAITRYLITRQLDFLAASEEKKIPALSTYLHARNRAPVRRFAHVHARLAQYARAWNRQRGHTSAEEAGRIETVIRRILNGHRLPFSSFYVSLFTFVPPLSLSGVVVYGSGRNFKDYRPRMSSCRLVSVVRTLGREKFKLAGLRVVISNSKCLTALI